MPKKCSESEIKALALQLLVQVPLFTNPVLAQKVLAAAAELAKQMGQVG